MYWWRQRGPNLQLLFWSFFPGIHLIFKQGLFLPGSLKDHFTANILTIATSISTASRNCSQQNFYQILPGHPQSPGSLQSTHLTADSNLLRMQMLPCHSLASNPPMVLHCVISTNIYRRPCTVIATRATSDNKTENLLPYTFWGKVRHQTKHKAINSMLEDKDIGKVGQVIEIMRLVYGQIALWAG